MHNVDAAAVATKIDGTQNWLLPVDFAFGSILLLLCVCVIVCRGHADDGPHKEIDDDDVAEKK